MATDEGIFDMVTDILELTQEENGILLVNNITVNQKKIMEPNIDLISVEEELNRLQDENFQFIRKQKSASTVRKTDKDVARFILYLRAKYEERNPEELDPRILDVHLSCYLKDLNKQDGGEYEPDSVTAVYGSLDRYLREKHYKASLMESSSFKNSRDMLEAKRKSLKALGKGNKPNQCFALTGDELESLWENGGFGDSNPEELTAAVWFVLSLHFGFRGSHESRQLKVGDIIEREDSKGDRYLEVNERLTKTRVGCGNTRSFNPKAWETGGRRCPVNIYQAYTSRKPIQMKEEGRPFYVAINHMRRENSPIWFSSAPLGHNSITQIMKNAGKRAGIGRSLTNHVVRKTSITCLVQAGVPHNIVAQHSGHKSVESIKHYAVASLQQQKVMSAILAHKAVSISNVIKIHVKISENTRHLSPAVVHLILINHHEFQ